MKRYERITTIKRRLTPFIVLFFLSVDPLFAQEVISFTPTVKRLEKALVQSGKFYFSTRRYDSAIQKWQLALILNPKAKYLERYIKDAERRLQSMPMPKDMVTETVPQAAQKAPYEKPKERILGMEECIRIAEINHIPLAIAKKSMKLADMKLWEARRNMLPTGALRLDEYSGRVSGGAYIGRKEYIEGTQPIFHGGELYFSMKQAEAGLEIAKNDYNKIRNELILQVKKAYYTLLKSKENLNIQNELFREAENISGMVNTGFQSGIISKLESLNVSSQINQVRFQLISAEGDRSVAELILKQAMNLDAKDRIGVRSRSGFKKVDIDFDKLLRIALMNRPEIKMNTLLVTYYKHGKSVASAKFWPKVDLMGNWGLAKEEFVSEDRQGPTNPGAAANQWTFNMDQKLEQQYYAGFKVSMPFWGSTAEYSWTREQWVPVVSAFQGTEALTQSYKINLFDNFKSYSDKQSADIDIDRARQELTKLRNEVTLEVRENCFGCEKALAQIETARNKLEYQAKEVEFNKLKRQMDEAQDSVLIDSLIKLAQERYSNVQAMTDYYTAIAGINKALGIEDYFTVDEEAR